MVISRRWMYLLIFVLLGLMLARLSGCAAKGWTSWQAIGLPKVNFNVHALVFFDERTGYLGGQYNDWSTRREAHLYRSDDGGHSWRRLPLPESRLGVQHITGRGQDVYVCLGDLYEPSAFLHSPDGGENWTAIRGTEAMVFMSRSNAAMALDSTGLLRIGANNLAPPKAPVLLSHEPSGAWKKTLMPDKALLMVSEHSALLLSVNADGDISEAAYMEDGPTLPLPVPLSHVYSVRGTPGPDRSWWLCGTDDADKRQSKIRVLRLRPEGCELTQFSVNRSGLPTLFTAHSQTFCVTAITSASIFGASHVLYVSRDGGAHWQETAPPFTLIMKPAFQYKEEFYIVSQGNAEFARLDFKALDGWF